MFENVVHYKKHQAKWKRFKNIFTKQLLRDSEVVNFYRPQTKFAKVMLSQVSVCPQGGGVPGQVPPPRQVHPLGR